MTETKTIAETNRYIVLDRYDKDCKLCESYQNEDALERELVIDLEDLGYIFERELNSPEKLLAVMSQSLLLDCRYRTAISFSADFFHLIYLFTLTFRRCPYFLPTRNKSLP